MGDLTTNISRHEIACRCGCGFDTIDYETIYIVQKACDNFAAKLKIPKVILDITSGFRCFAYNTLSDGEKNSYHIKGKAIDHIIRGVHPDELYNYYNKHYPKKYGLGLYRTFVHIDCRPEKARW